MARTVIGDSTAADGLNVNGSIQVGGTEVINSAGEIKADIKDTLAYGSIYVGDATNTTSEVDFSGNGKILVGNGTTATSQTLGGDGSVNGTGTFTVQNLGPNVTSAASGGTANTGVTAQEFGTAYDHTTVLGVAGLAVPGPVGAANLALGYLLYTFPAGAHIQTVSYINVALQGGGTVDADTPEVGLGSVLASGAHATLGAAPAGSEDYLVGTAAADCNGTATLVGPVGATAGYGTDISLNGEAGVKTLHLNYADGWAGADTLTATGFIVVKWGTIAVTP